LVVRYACDSAVSHDRNDPKSTFDEAAAAVGPAALDKDAERHAATEIVEVCAPELEVLERPGDVFPELPYRLMPYEGTPLN
jgi:hypothetical protein